MIASLTDVDTDKLEKKRAHAEFKRSRISKFAKGTEPSGTLSIRYRNGSVGLIDGVGLAEWNRIAGQLTEKGSFSVVCVLSSGSITIINLTEVARISWIVDRAEDQS